jgi:hypothetical protein
LLAPQRGLIAIGQNQTLISQPMVSVFVAVIPAKSHEPDSVQGESRFCPALDAGNPMSFLIPGRVSLARNDDPTPENVNLCKSPAEPGVPKG